MTVSEMQDQAYESAKRRGFYDGTLNIPELLILINSEVSEAMTAYQTNSHASLAILAETYPVKSSESEDYDTSYRLLVKDTFEDELADIVLRTASLCGRLGIDLEAHAIVKMDYNSRRTY